MKKFLYKDPQNRTSEVDSYDPSDFVSSSSGVPDAGKPIKTDSLGKIDPSLLAFVPSAQRLETTYVAGVAVGALKFVRVNASQELILGGNDTYNNSKVIGITLEAGGIGDEVTILLFGKLDDVSFTFPVNDSLFLSASGAITNVPPTSGTSTLVGHSLGVGSIFVKIERPITL
jgi:hypothetical protein